MGFATSVWPGRKDSSFVGMTRGPPRGLGAREATSMTKMIFDSAALRSGRQLCDHTMAHDLGFNQPVMEEPELTGLPYRPDLVRVPNRGAGAVRWAAPASGPTLAKVDLTRGARRTDHARTVPDPGVGANPDRRHPTANSWRARRSQVLGGLGTGSVAAVGALLAADLATESLSGLSSAGSVVGSALIALPVSRIMQDGGVALASSSPTRRRDRHHDRGARRRPRFLRDRHDRCRPDRWRMTAGLQSRYAATDLATPHRRGRSLATVVWATTVGSVRGRTWPRRWAASPSRSGSRSWRGPTC